MKKFCLLAILLVNSYLPAFAEVESIAVDKMPLSLYEEIQRGWPYNQSVCIMSVLEELKVAPLPEQKQNTIRWDYDGMWIELVTKNEINTTKWRCESNVVKTSELHDGKERWSEISYEELFPG